jgi:anthranilate synthase/aminodeoxychorismate synthase-like glutamine amidotransferase
MLLLIDNYDSFTYNLVQLFGMVQPGLDVRVVRNDKISLGEIEALKPTHICISPGPCSPKESGISNDVVRTFAPRIPTLGVCLGHQCIGFVSGAVGEKLTAWLAEHGVSYVLTRPDFYVAATADSPEQPMRVGSRLKA